MRRAGPFIGKIRLLNRWRSAEYIREHSAPDARVAVLGSEPQIYFYAHRRSASGFIYMYDLVQLHDYAGQFQREMIAEIEAAKPLFLVMVIGVKFLVGLAGRGPYAARTGADRYTAPVL